VIVVSLVLAAALILAQGFAVWGFLRFVRSFGAYTESQAHLTAAILTVHESNLLLHREQVRVLEELRAMQHRPVTKEVA
jgi:hypothetical protein